MFSLFSGSRRWQAFWNLSGGTPQLCLKVNISNVALINLGLALWLCPPPHSTGDHPLRGLWTDNNTWEQQHSDFILKVLPLKDPAMRVGPVRTRATAAFLGSRSRTVGSLQGWTSRLPHKGKKKSLFLLLLLRPLWILKPIARSKSAFSCARSTQVYQYYGKGYGALVAITFNLARGVDDIYMDSMSQTNFTAYPILKEVITMNFSWLQWILVCFCRMKLLAWEMVVWLYVQACV